MGATTNNSNPVARMAQQQLSQFNPFANIASPLDQVQQFTALLPDDSRKKVDEVVGKGQKTIADLAEKGDGLFQKFLTMLMNLLTPIFKWVRNLFDKNGEAIDNALVDVVAAAKTKSFVDLENASQIEGLAARLSELTESATSSLYVFNVKLTDDPTKAIGAAYEAHKQVYAEVREKLMAVHADTATPAQIDAQASRIASAYSGLPLDASKDDFDISTVSAATVKSGIARFYLDVQAAAKSGGAMPTSITINTTSIKMDDPAAVATAREQAAQQPKPEMSLAERAYAAVTGSRKPDAPAVPARA